MDVFGLTLLDLVMLLALLAFFIHGYRRGLWITAGRMIGFVVGGISAFFMVPWIMTLVPSPGWRLAAVWASVLMLVTLGWFIGGGLGRAVRLRVNQPALRVIDKVLGAGINTAIAAVMISMVSYSLAQLGVPAMTTAIKQSKVISTVNSLTPEATQGFFTQLRSELLDAHMVPELALPVQAPPTPAEPTTAPPNAEIERASSSTVRITGTAYECGQSQTGSGFAVETNRVVTNAHVVAGVTEPLVESLDGEIYVGEVVHFDPSRDLAVIAFDGDIEALDTGERLAEDDDAYVLGYPAGGPFRIAPASVQAVGEVSINTIYGQDAELTDIYQLNADVKQGNSGGPLVDEQGDVVGVVFAKAASDITVGYAITGEEAGDVLTNAGSYTGAVSTGQCVG
ncbi:MarP family serine protease [Citricoccus muralis]|uniref:MarP family serine protease n=1 Tax=Citricoccus muralis TaxID=169134 RepID=A0ABY8H585_9MICC|nr:MarP family serine protease [Citricoccus muralis]WFP16004.1 MarP family serine protease [Citricoccus muralis]